MKKLLLILLVAPLCSALSWGAGDAIAVAGYETGRDILTKLLPAAGLNGVNRLDQPLRVDAYKDFSAVLWVEQIKDPSALESSSVWDDPANEALLLEYLRGGGRIVVLGQAIPLAKGQIRLWGTLSEVMGISGIMKAKVRPLVKLLDPQDPLFANLTVPAEGFRWAGDGAKAGREPVLGKVLATVESEDGQVLPFITVREVGKGKLYWLGAVPKRLEQNGTPLDQLSAYQTVLLRALGYTGAPVTAQKQVPDILAAAQAAGWGLQPLGKAGPSSPPPTSKKIPPTLPLRQTEELSGDPLPLSESGQPKAFLVLGGSPTEAAQQAAALLQKEILASTGAQLPIVSESRVRVEKDGRLTMEGREDLTTALVVGNTALGQSQNLSLEGVSEEGFRIEPMGNAIFLVGRDTNSQGLKTSGTYFAAIEFLEFTTGVRWLWPGEAGTVRPTRSSLAAKLRRVQDAPALSIRKLRNLGGIGGAYHHEGSESSAQVSPAKPKRDSLTGFARRMADGIELMGIDYADFLKRHSPASAWFDTARLGSHIRINAGHAFHGWYEKYHSQHPDWFALQPDGTRNQVPVRETFCTSQEGFRDAAAQQILDQLKADPNLTGFSASLNDGGQNTFCMCEICRAQDPPDGPKISFRYEQNGKEIYVPYVSMTDRILHYYNGVAERVVRSRPSALVGAQAYSYYRAPPRQTSVHPALVISFVGLSYLDQSRHSADLESWDRWSALSNRLIVRPNTLHTGHGYPAIFVRRLAADLKRCFQTGMIGADFDSVCHHWANQGLNYYVLSRLLWNPMIDPADVVADYCRAGFGEGAPAMRKYFDQIETMTEAVAAKVGQAVETALRDEEDLNAGRFALAQQIEELNRAYAPPVEAQLRSYLEEADRLAAGDPPSQERIQFVRCGLDYVAAQRTLYAAVDSANGKDALRDRNKILTQLYENDYFAVNVPVILWRETALISKLGGAKTPKK